MFLFMYIGILITIYVVTFNSDFTKEHIDKVVPFVVAGAALVFLFGLVLGV